MPLPTQANKNTLKAHIAANTNTVLIGGANVAINAVTDAGDNYLRVAEWYNALVTEAESQPFATPNELWVPDVPVQSLNAAVDWGTQIPHGLGGTPTVSEQYLARVYKMLAWQSLTWNSRLDMTDTQQRAGVMNTFNSTLNTPTPTTTAIAAVGVGRKVPRRIERLFAGAAVGQAGVGGAVGRVCPTALYGYSLSEGDVRDAILNGV